MQVRLHRRAAGIYYGTAGGHNIEIVYDPKDEYGDHGWRWWIDGEGSDFPMDTLRDAKSSLMLNLNAHATE